MIRKDKIRINIDLSLEPLTPINNLPPLPKTLEFQHTFVSLETYEKFAIDQLAKHLIYDKMILDERTGLWELFIENNDKTTTTTNIKNETNFDMNNNNNKLESFSQGQDKSYLNDEEILDIDVDDENESSNDKKPKPEVWTSGLYFALRSEFILKFALMRYLNYIFDDIDSDLYIIVSLGQINVISDYLGEKFFKRLMNFDFERKKGPRLRFLILDPKNNSYILKYRQLKFDYIILEAMNFILNHIYMSTGRILVDHVHSYIPGKNLGTFFDSLQNDFVDCKWILKFDHLEGDFFKNFNYLDRGVVDVIWEFDNIYDRHFFFILRTFMRIGYLGSFEKLERPDVFNIRAYVPLVQTLTNIYMSKFDRLLVRNLLPSLNLIGRRISGKNKFAYIRYDTKFIIGLQCGKLPATKFREELYEIMLLGLWRKPWTWVFKKMYKLLSEQTKESDFRFMNFDIHSVLVLGKWKPNISLPFRIIYKLLKIEGMVEDIPLCNISDKHSYNDEVDWFIGTIIVQSKIAYNLVKHPLSYILAYYNHIYLTVYIYCRFCNDKSTIYQLYDLLYTSFLDTIIYKFGFDPSNEIISLGLSFVEKDPDIGPLSDIKLLENLADFNYLFYKSKISLYKTIKMPFIPYPIRLEPVYKCERLGWNQLPLSLSLSRYLRPAFSILSRQRKRRRSFRGRQSKKKYFVRLIDSFLHEGYFLNFMYDNDVQRRYTDRSLVFKYIHNQYRTKVEFTSIANKRTGFLLNKPEDLFAADVNTERGTNYNLPFTRVKRVKLNGVTVARIIMEDRSDIHFVQLKHQDCWWLTESTIFKKYVDNDGNSN